MSDVDLATLTRISDRIGSRYDINGRTGCWEWRGAVTVKGYGVFTVAGRRVAAHRAFWVLANGRAVPDGLQLDHLCRNRPCVNPAHLEPVTSRENTLRSPISQASLNAAKTHCPAGHPYDAANTYAHPTAGRRCRECTRMHVRLSSRRRRAAAKR